MPLIRRGRPLARAAMVGGAGYAVGKHRARQQEQEQQAQQAAAPPATQSVDEPVQAGSGGMSEMDRIDALKKLGDLHDSGVLSDQQFETEKEKLI